MLKVMFKTMFVVIFKVNLPQIVFFITAFTLQLNKYHIVRGFDLIDLLDKVMVMIQPWSQVPFLFPPDTALSFYRPQGSAFPLMYQLLMVVNFCRLCYLTLSSFLPLTVIFYARESP